MSVPLKHASRFDKRQKQRRRRNGTCSNVSQPRPNSLLRQNIIKRVLLPMSANPTKTQDL